MHSCCTCASFSLLRIQYPLLRVSLLQVHMYLFMYVHNNIIDRCQHADIYMYTCLFIETTHCNILAVADEEGSLRLLNVTKSATDSLVKGIYA